MSACDVRFGTVIGSFYLDKECGNKALTVTVRRGGVPVEEDAIFVINKRRWLLCAGCKALYESKNGIEIEPV